MTSSGIVAAGLSLVFVASCGGQTTLSPTGPSLTVATMVTPTPNAPSIPTPMPTPMPTPAPAAPSIPISGVVGPLIDGAAPCFADRYACEVYDFSLARAGSIEVMLTWEGPARALMVQLYWAGEGLAHEDVAPRTGPSRISFTRPRMEAAHYRVRVVSLEPGSTIPFTLMLTY